MAPMFPLAGWLITVALEDISVADGADVEPSLEVGSIQAPTGSADGALSEWTAPPTMVTRDLEGHESRIWIAIDGDRVRIAAKGDVARVEIALASPPPTLPPLGWRSWDDVTELAGVEDCQALVAAGGTALPDELERCHTWVRQAIADRDALAARFRSRIVIEERATIDGTSSDAQVVRRGDVLEVDLPITALPATTQIPLTALRVLSRVGARSSRWGEPPPELWPLAELATPVRFGAHPELAAAAVAHTDLQQRLTFYEPGVSGSRVQLVYHHTSYELGIPSAPSPAIAELSTEKPRRVGSFDGQALVQIPVDMGDEHVMEQLALLTADGRVRLLESTFVESAPARVVRRDGGLDLVYLEAGIRNPAGRGYCFACDKVSVHVLRVDKNGGSRLFDEAVDADAMERLDTSVSPSGAVKVRAFTDTNAEGKPLGSPRVTHVTRIAFDAASGGWLRHDE